MASIAPAIVKLENHTKAALGVVGICMLEPGINEVDAETFAKLKAHKCGDVSYLKALAKEGKIGLAAKPLAVDAEPAGG